ncbi:28S ribosomal protein S35, mitochondrial [Lamellibrachia satsuma]|nr:28S ribosomal protein S35, mitochondrial [Lamellibrachia satsuma]
MAASKAACGVLRGFAGKRTFSLLSDNTNRYAIQSRTYASVIQHAVDKIGPIEVDDDEFRVLVIPGHTLAPERKRMERRKQKEVPPPRYKKMATDQDWTSVWPTAEAFKWSVVPFPVRQGFAQRQENEGIPPGKYANAELVKIPNFLHLTPAHIKQHCAAMKKYCNAWPAGLETDEQCEKHFPLVVITRSYLVDSPSIRDPRARIVTFQVKLSSLNLDYHARDKLLRLVGDRYNRDTDVLTITTDRCPLKKQNYDYANYLLTALCLESRKTEPMGVREDSR